jgi:hypothetical protein
VRRQRPDHRGAVLGPQLRCRRTDHQDLRRQRHQEDASGVNSTSYEFAGVCPTE